TLSGDQRYHAYFKMIPNTKIKYQIDIRPVEGIQLSLNATYRSSVKWAEFAAVDGHQYHLPSVIPITRFEQTFHTKIPAFLNVGFNIKKWLFNKHLQVQMGILNILDQEVRYHAIGASLFPKVNFKISFHF